MSSGHGTHTSTLGRARLPFGKSADVDEFVATLEKYERGDITADEWRVFRLLRGTYGQRQDGDAYMLRVKIPQGILTATQLRVLADVGERYSRGFGHITTRQNVQFHFVKLHDAEAAMRILTDAGLTTREACGNSVRNVTACVYAGVAPDEVFDVTPYADALTRYFLGSPLASSLPRKFKIAWEGCTVDHAVLGIHDLGWRAMVVDGQRGFRVTVGGGTAILCRTGAALVDFLPARDILQVAEAVLLVFHDLGDFAHKKRNRLKFLIKELGWEKFLAAFNERLERLRAEGFNARLPFDPDAPDEEIAPPGERPVPPTVAETMARAASSQLSGPGLHPEITPFVPAMNGDWHHWRRTNTTRQKQAGYSVVTVTVPLGDLSGEQMRLLADFALAYGDGTVRLSADQNLVFRWVPTGQVGDLYQRLAAAGLGLPDANTIADVVSCPGAESCKLAVTQSRGLGRTLGEFLRSRPDLVVAAEDLQIKMSGCPNGCGRHHIAGIGFQGSMRKVEGRVVPQYFVLLGGASLDDGTARFGRLAAKIPARRMTQALERLIGLYQQERTEGETATAFFGRVELSAAKRVLADLEEMPLSDTTPDDFVDLGDTTQFEVVAMEGECAS